MAAGGVPFPLIVKVAALMKRASAALSDQAPEGPEPAAITSEELEHLHAYHNELVRRAVVRLGPSLADMNGQPEQEFSLESVQELDERDWQMILRWAGRDEEIPKVGASTSTDSPDSSSPPQDASSPEPSDSGNVTQPPELETT